MRQFVSRAAPCLAAAAVVPAGRVLCEQPPASRNPLHHLSPDLQHRGQAPFAGKVSTFGRNPKETVVVRIALTGGPCAGKSSALETIIASVKTEGYDVICAPETATLLFNSGVQFPDSPESWQVFQQSLARMQLQMERSLTKIASKTGRPTIIVFDRGLLDAKGYMDDASWKRLITDFGSGGESGMRMHEGGIDEEYLLKRYDAVVHLVTAADGAEKFYKWGKVDDDAGNAVVRFETPEEARALDKKMQESWKNHKAHIVIKNTSDGVNIGFQAKLDAVSKAVLAVAKTKHPRSP